MQKYTEIDIYNAKNYMSEYKIRLVDYNQQLGFFGRFFEKLFGTKKYDKIENWLRYNYNLTYAEAVSILTQTNNSKNIFQPF